MAPKRPSASPSPAARRTTPRSNAGTQPKRLGDDDGFTDSKASTFKSPKVESKPSKDDKKSMFSVVGPSDVLVLAAAAYVFAIMLPAPVPTTPPTNIPYFVAMMLAVATSHVLYAFVWYKTKSFKKLCKKAPLKFIGKMPVTVFGNLVLGIKMFQQLSLAAWAFSFVGSVDKFKALVLTRSPEYFAAAAALFLAGQVLNAAIYKAIGKDGVYYGFKLGRTVAWSTAFPFSAGFRHPQYVGGYTTQLGVLLLVASPATIAGGLVPLAGWWALCYIITSIVEASDDNDD